MAEPMAHQPARDAPGLGSAQSPLQDPLRTRPAPAGGGARLSFASAPMLFCGIWLAAGILLSHASRAPWIEPGLLVLAVAAAILLSLTAARAAPRCSLPAAGFCWLMLGALLAGIQPEADPQTALALHAAAAGRQTVEGRISRIMPVRLTGNESLFIPRDRQEPRQEQSESIDLRVRTVDGAPAPGGLRATLYGPADRPFPELHCGDMVLGSFTLRLPERYRDPGAWDSRAWLLEQGIGAIGSGKISDFAIASSPGRSGFACWLRSLQEKASRRLNGFSQSGPERALPSMLRLDREDTAMLSAMALGDRSYLERRARAGFERTGSFHLLVVSGMHLAIFAGCAFGLAALLRLPRLWSTLITILCSFAYAQLTGFGAPVQRSFWMVTLYLLARLLFRQRNGLNAVGFAALCLLALDPRSLLGASFQMTLLSVLVVAGIAVPIAERTLAPYLQAARTVDLIALDPSLPPRLAQFRVALRLASDHLRPLLGRRAARWLPPALVRLALRGAELLGVSALIELAMSLPMAVYFHRVTVMALPVNVLIVPLLGLALPCALATVVAILIAPALAALPAAATALLLHAIAGIVRLFGSLPGADLRIPAPPPGAVAAGVLLLGFAVWAARNGRRPSLLALAALAGCAVCAVYPYPAVFRPGVLEIAALDVGQGDSLLLTSPQGRTLLIDAGGPIGAGENFSSNFDIGEDVVSPALWSRRIRRLDAVALTHAHSDHMGGMPAVLENFRPAELWVGKNPDIPAYRALLRQAASLGIRVRSFAAGDAFDFAGARIEVLAPARDYRPGAAASNDDSLVLRVAYGSTSALLEGDAEAPSERRMLGEDLRSNLLKVGHHGSTTSTTAPFLAQVDPRFAVISAGLRNPFGHPRIQVLDRLQQDRVLTYRTDLLGATTFELDGRSVTAQTAGP